MSVGKFADQGFAVGLTRHAGQVEEASKDVGKTAVDSLKKSMSGLSAIVNDEMDADPVIRPVLDLSEVRKGAGQMSGLMAGKKLSVTGSYADASGIMATSRESSSVTTPSDANPVVKGGDINFYQTNNSPKALSRIEIYRNTRNQLSSARGALSAGANRR